MALYDRLIGFNDAGDRVDNKIPLHQFASLLAEFGRGKLTGQQAQDAIVALTGAPLDAAGIAEATTLLQTIAGTAVAKLARAVEIQDVLILGEGRIVQYDTPAEIKVRLGV